MQKQGMFFSVLLLIVLVLGFLIYFKTDSRNNSRTGKGSENPVQVQVSGKIDFKTHDAGIKLVKSLNKKAFVFFHADWCKYCKDMEKGAFLNAQVIKYLNDNFISIEVDTDVEEETSSKYKIKGLPQLYFLEEDGSPIRYRPGFVDTEELFQLLKYINTDSYKKMAFRDFVNQN